MIGFKNVFNNFTGDGKKTGLSNSFDGGGDELIGVKSYFYGNGLNYGTKTTITTIGSGTRMFFNPHKAAFRAGYAEGNMWDDAHIDAYSMAIGNKVEASGGGSIAWGFGNTSSGSFATAMGYYTTASGENAVTMGDQTTAPSFDEIAIGCNNTTYTPAGTTSWNLSDRLFTIGNGTSLSNKSDALIVYKNGNTELYEKLTAPVSGNSDMKAYVYGYLTSSGGSVSIDTNKSSSGFTVSRIVAGKYRVSFTESGLSDYLITANAIATANPRFVTYVTKVS